MNVLHDIPISLTSEYVIQEQYRRRRKPVTAFGQLVETATQAVELGLPLIAPAVVYDEVPVLDVAGGQVTVHVGSNGPEKTILTVGPRADLLAPARQVLVAVLTIGPVLEHRVQALNAEGEILLAYMLDSVGVLALGQVGEVVHRLAETRAAEAGWSVGPAISPGSLAGWPHHGQREVCGLLHLETIGVQLNEYCVLVPHKSVSTVIGMGPGYEAHHVESVCRYCALADTCWRRREDAA